MQTYVLLPARGGVFRSPALVGADVALRWYRGWCLLGTFRRLLGDFGVLGYLRMCFQPRDLSVGCYLLPPLPPVWCVLLFALLFAQLL